MKTLTRDWKQTIIHYIASDYAFYIKHFVVLHSDYKIRIFMPEIHIEKRSFPHKWLKYSSEKWVSGQKLTYMYITVDDKSDYMYRVLSTNCTLKQNLKTLLWFYTRVFKWQLECFFWFFSHQLISTWKWPYFDSLCLWVLLALERRVP